jgi:hypothetical protein
MRKINVLEFVSLDGVIQAPGGSGEDTSGGFEYGGWTHPYSDPVSGAAMMKQMNMPFDLLLGRKLLTFGQNSGHNIMRCGRPSTQPPSTSPQIP